MICILVKKKVIQVIFYGIAYKLIEHAYKNCNWT